MANIYIAVACHKKSVLPDNSLFHPVQVNADHASELLMMEHDNTGDNISDKNASYCELTAQYWVWKNIEADYYGLCHYRRFLTFKENVDCVLNERRHYDAVEAGDFNFERFGLEDEEEMRRVIEDNDIVIGNLQNVFDLYTPRGNKVTAYQHWEAHDRTLINIEDLKTMLDILEENDDVQNVWHNWDED